MPLFLGKNEILENKPSFMVGNQEVDAIYVGNKLAWRRKRSTPYMLTAYEVYNEGNGWTMEITSGAFNDEEPIIRMMNESVVVRIMHGSGGSTTAYAIAVFTRDDKISTGGCSKVTVKKPTGIDISGDIYLGNVCILSSDWLDIKEKDEFTTDIDTNFDLQTLKISANDYGDRDSRRYCGFEYLYFHN